MAELTDRRRNAILQTAIVRVTMKKMRGAPESYTPEEKECYEGYEAQILDDISKGIKPNYSIACSNDDW